MAAADPGSDSDGSWADYPEENAERAAVLNREIARRGQVLQYRLSHNDWCSCGKCCPVQFAESAFDVTCCQECDVVKAVCQQNELFGTSEAYNCICDHPSFFTLCLYQMHLDHISYLYKMDGVDPRAYGRNEKLRYVAYRSYTGWIHGYLGRGKRRVIPQCVYKAIRKAFPDDQGEYRGFRERRAAEPQE